MAYQPQSAQVLFSSESASLADAASITSGYLDLQDYDKYQISIYADAVGLTFTQQSRLSDSGAVLSNDTPLARTSFLGAFIVRQRYINFTVTNDTGSAVANVRVEVKGTVGGSDKASTFPLGDTPVTFSPAQLTQSVIIGQDPSDSYVNTSVNEAGALIVGSFGTEVSRGLYNGYSISTKFGRNPEVDTGSAPEDLWNGGGSYTGFDTDGNQNLETLSANAADSGSLVSSGTATGGSSTTLVDSGATFVTDGAAVGDCVILDNKSAHGFITSLTETTLTIREWMLETTNGITAESGDTYRVATVSSTGAGVVKWVDPMDEDRAVQSPVYVIMNGTTAVTTTGNFDRLTRGRVIYGGTNGQEGVITARQASTGTVFAQMPTFGQTTIGAFTVPAEKVCLIKRILVSIVRSNGSAGSATILLNVRERGGAWNAKRVLEISTSGPVEDRLEGAIVLRPQSDVKYTINSVSDNDTIVSGEIEYYLVDE